jgi:hypothetical protein
MPIDEFARFMNRRGTSTQWFFMDEVLYDGEVGIEKTVDGRIRIKVGDGVTPWNSLPYIGSDDYPTAADTDLLQKSAIDDAIATTIDADPRIPTLDEKHALAGSYGPPDALNVYTTTTDPRIPTQDENDALAGSYGSPDSSNAYVTTTDPRMSDERVPTTHASTHEASGSDELALADLSGNLTQGRSHDSADTDVSTSSIHHTLGTGPYNAATGNDSRFPTAGQKSALVGTSGTPGVGNEYVTKVDPKYSGALTQSIGYQITGHSSVALTQTSDAVYTYAISEFTGGAGFDPSKISGFFIFCYTYCGSSAGKRSASILGTIFGTQYALLRTSAGTGLYNESQSGSSVAYMPIYSGQTDLVIEISSSSSASGSFTILGATLSK